MRARSNPNALGGALTTQPGSVLRVDSGSGPFAHAVLTVTGTGAYRFVDQASTSGSYRMHDGAWRAVTETELRNAEEIWIASSGRAVMPVTKLDGRAVGAGTGRSKKEAEQRAAREAVLALEAAADRGA